MEDYESIVDVDTILLNRDIVIWLCIYNMTI
jgi:hypothetical protein